MAGLLIILMSQKHASLSKDEESHVIIHSRGKGQVAGFPPPNVSPFQFSEMFLLLILAKWFHGDEPSSQAGFEGLSSANVSNGLVRWAAYVAKLAPTTS